jgi:orotidine-5'-phosphate decarboxylase
VNTELIVVLDVDTRDEAMGIVDACVGCDWFKVGSQLFTRCGPDLVRALVAANKKVMLDLKFYDIPNTVQHGAAAAADLGVSLCTLHASGGRAMIGAARQAVEGSETRLLAVTVLTSFSETAWRDEVGVPESPETSVRRLAVQSVDAGAHGIVCSPLEIGVVREAVGDEALVVTPGIRPAWASRDDQQRIMTPGNAKQAGASYIVVGRPILTHADPAEAVRLIQEELA